MSFSAVELCMSWTVNKLTTHNDVKVFDYLLHCSEKLIHSAKLYRDLWKYIHILPSYNQDHSPLSKSIPFRMWTLLALCLSWANSPKQSYLRKMLHWYAINELCLWESSLLCQCWLLGAKNSSQMFGKTPPRHANKTVGFITPDLKLILSLGTLLKWV